MAQAARGALTGGAWGSDAAGSGRCVGVTRSKSESESESESDRASRVPGFPWRRGAIKPGRRSASPPRSVRFCSSVDSRHPDRSLLYFDREAASISIHYQGSRLLRDGRRRPPPDEEEAAAAGDERVGRDAAEEDEEIGGGGVRDPQGEQGGGGGCSSHAFQAYPGGSGYLDGSLAGDEGQDGGRGGGGDQEQEEEEGGQAQGAQGAHRPHGGLAVRQRQHPHSCSAGKAFP